jgi:hypothetical protein
MRQVLGVGIICMFCVLSARGENCSSEKEWGPDKVVEHVWNLATQGDLLTPEGWDKAARAFFVYPSPVPGDKVRLISPEGRAIAITSNEWGIVDCKIEGNTAKVVVEYYDDGKIDSSLQYTPGKEPPPMGKSSMVFTLILAPTHKVTMYKPIGNGFAYGNVITGSPAWQIESPQGPRWATVNTAIRYVLEMRNQTNSPTIRKNAESTLSQLLRLH